MTAAAQAGFGSPLAADANEGLAALITGGGTGIGLATAREFVRTGARVAIAGRRADVLEAAAAELRRAGGECVAVPTDVRDPDRAEALVSATLEAFGRIDVLVNSAGGQFEAPAEDISLKGWRAVHRLAVDAGWSLTRSVAVRSMIPSGGGLVIFIGFSPRRGIPGVVHASAARAALENLASGLAIEWSHYGVRAVCVAAGNIDTEGLASYGPAALEEARRQVPLGRLGRPEEIAAVIAFLASAGGAYVTGTTIVVDGGVDAWGQGSPPPAADRS